jgi:hypothetical protein
MTTNASQNTTEIDYSKPHAFEMEVGRITRVCKCGQPQGVAIHNTSPEGCDAGRYGYYYNGCLRKAAKELDMPLFVLKPSDVLAIRAIEQWILDATLHGVAKALIDDALQVRNAFRAWQERNPARVKAPD